MRVGFVYLVAWLALLMVSGVSADDGTGSLLLRVERVSRDDLSHLLAAGVPVVMETRPCLFVRGGSDHLRWLDDHGYSSLVLDDRADVSEYVVVGVRPDSDMEALRAIGVLLHEEENWQLIRTYPGVSLDELGSARVFLTPVSREPVKIPRSPVRGPASRAEDSGPADPLVQKIVDQVLPADIDQLWLDLTDNPPTGTRLSTHQGCRDAADYCYDLYDALDLPVEYQEWNTGHAPNVIATQEGAVYPDDVYIIEGHLDDLPASGPAPGADDNASGSVTVLEAAKVMACYAFKSTVKYLNVTGEESGLNGSEAYADDAWARGEKILGVINMDMNGWEGNGVPAVENLDLNYNSTSEWLGLLFAECAQKYGTGLSVDAFYCPSLSASDHYPFWQKGWSAVCGITDNEGYCGHGGNYPYYHTSDDTIENCGDPAFFHSAVKASVATLAEMAEPFKITTSKSTFACGTGIELVVGDRDLDTDPGTPETVVVEVWSDTETTPELVTLSERDLSSMIFEGAAPTIVAPPTTGDGVLSVAPGDAVHARYVDSLDCDGATGVSYTASATIDCVEPIISNVQQQAVTDTTAVVTWETDEESTSVVRWGEAPPPGGTTSDPALTTSHSVTLTGLQPCTVYYYSVESEDLAGNPATEDNGGSFYHFETLGDFGSGLQPCHAGRVSVDQGVFSCSDTATFRVVDMDLNLDGQAVDTATLWLTSTTETQEEMVTAVETGPNTSVFAGSIATATGDPVADGVLQTQDGDILTVTYRDADDGAGMAAISFDVAALDCGGPVITGLHVDTITHARATVRWTTDELADTVVEWGDTPALGQISSSGAWVTQHAIVLNQFDSCGEAYFRVRSTDELGSTTVVDNHGQPFLLATYDIPGLYWMDDFENGNTGWSLTGEWEIGSPQGHGGSSGIADPTAAYNNQSILGHDLSGQGAFAGDYEPNVAESAESPVLNPSTWTNTRLILHRKLSVGSGDSASLELWLGPLAVPLFNSEGTVSDGVYKVLAFDLSHVVDGRPMVFLDFSQVSDASGQYSGWNLDDVIFKDGSLPDYAACGGCGTAPSFAGAVSAVDNDACALAGVTVSWERAVSWGTGSGGTYSVFRDTTPGFTPSGANLLASGLTGLSFNDATAPGDQTLYYVVQAENDETCSTGPNNGGLTDGNSGDVPVDVTTTRPVPGAVETVRANLIGQAHVRLQWDPVADAASYRIYRSTSPQPGSFTLLAETGTLLYEDIGVGPTGDSFYYEVVAVNTCGQEGAR